MYEMSKVTCHVIKFKKRDIFFIQVEILSAEEFGTYSINEWNNEYWL